MHRFCRALQLPVVQAHPPSQCGVTFLVLYSCIIFLGKMSTLWFASDPLLIDGARLNIQDVVWCTTGNKLGGQEVDTNIWVSQFYDWHKIWNMKLTSPPPLISSATGKFQTKIDCTVPVNATQHSNPLPHETPTFANLHHLTMT